MPRSTQAEWIGAIGVQLAPLVQAMREDLLARRALHADETPFAMLKPGLGDNNRVENLIRPIALGASKTGCSPAASVPAERRRRS